MIHQLQDVLIIANTAKEGAVEMTQHIAAYLRERNSDVEVFEYDRGASSLPGDRRFDLAITLGGDGTVLFASRVLAERDTPILPVNLGEFGFITEVSRDEWAAAIEAFRRGEILAGDRLVLDVCVFRNDTELCHFRGLNDAVVSSEGISRMVRLSVQLGDQPLGVYRADGIMVATPTGSTAYSAAAGGPILHPEMDALILNPICPFTLSHRPIVLPPDETVRITVQPEQRTSVALTVDGQTLTPLSIGDHIVITSAHARARIIRSDQRTFYEVLRRKLNWSGGSDD
jgi:NAD+ kinase